MSRLPLTLACWNYDRTRALADGTVRPDGIDLEYFGLDVEETFFRMLRHREFDAAEMSLSSYAMTVDRGDSPFVAIPAFPSRMGGLAAAKRGECDIAGIHLMDPQSGEYNRPLLTESLSLVPGYGRMRSNKPSSTRNVESRNVRSSVPCVCTVKR